MEITNQPSLVELFKMLPQEMQMGVFELMDGSSLTALGSTCKTFHLLTEKQSLWNTLLNKIGMLQEYQFTKCENPYLSQFANIFDGRCVIVTEKQAYLLWIKKMSFIPKK